MRLAFTKMHGLGNDFIVFEAAARKMWLQQGVINEPAAVTCRGRGHDGGDGPLHRRRSRVDA